MASKKQNSTSAAIVRDQALAKYTRAKAAYRADPANTKKRNAYRGAKNKLAAATAAWRAWRIDNPGDADAHAKLTTIAAKAGK